jgi:hypothetical protein
VRAPAVVLKLPLPRAFALKPSRRVHASMADIVWARAEMSLCNSMPPSLA